MTPIFFLFCEACSDDPYWVATHLLVNSRGQNSDLNDYDLTDIFCILHPVSKAACEAIAEIAKVAPGRTNSTTGVELKLRGNNETDLASGIPLQAIALRLSTGLKQFCFGRNPQRCHFVL